VTLSAAAGEHAFAAEPLTLETSRPQSERVVDRLCRAAVAPTVPRCAAVARPQDRMSGRGAMSWAFSRVSALRDGCRSDSSARRPHRGDRDDPVEKRVLGVPGSVEAWSGPEVISLADAGSNDSSPRPSGLDHLPAAQLFFLGRRPNDRNRDEAQPSIGSQKVRSQVLLLPKRGNPSARCSKASPALAAGMDAATKPGTVESASAAQRRGGRCDARVGGRHTQMT
jgi:hypothetical protein